MAAGKFGSVQEVRERARGLGQQVHLRPSPVRLAGWSSKGSPCRRQDRLPGITAGISNPASPPWLVTACLLYRFLLDLACLFLLLPPFCLVLLLRHVLFLLATQVPRQPLLHVFGRLA